jgi:hypothetical protein
MSHDAGGEVFLIGQHRATLQAGRLQAMMTGGGDGLLVRFGRPAAMQQAHGAPGFVFVQTIQRVTRADASLAPGTQIKVDAKRVLLAAGRPADRQQVLVMTRS